MTLQRVTALAGLLGALALLAPRMLDGGRIIDSDEAFSVLLAGQDFGSFMRGAIADRPHPPLHVFLLYLIARLPFDTALLGRWFGIVASGAGFALLARMAFQQTRSVAVAACVLLVFAFSDFFIYRSMAIRPYPLIIALGCAQLYCFVALLEQPSVKGRPFPLPLRWWLACSVLLMSTQYLSLPVTGVEWLILATVLERQALMRSLAVLAAGAAGLALWYYLGSLHAASLAATWWATAKPDIRQLVFVALTFFGSAPLSAMWLGALFVLIFGNAVLQWRRLAPYELALFVVALAPLAAVFALSLFGPLNLFAQRQLIVPALALIVLTCSLTRLLPRAPQWICLCLIVAWAAASLPMGLPRHAKPPFGPMADSLAARGIRQVYSTEWELSGLRYYAASRFAVTALTQQHTQQQAILPDGNTAFVCRPQKCAPLAPAMRAVPMCGRRIDWNMINYAYSAQVLVFFPAARLHPGEPCGSDVTPD